MSYGLEETVSWLVSTLREVEALASQGRLTVLIARGEATPKPNYFASIRHGIEHYLRDHAIEQDMLTVRELRESLRKTRLACEDDYQRRTLAWYSKSIDKLLLHIPHFIDQRNTTLERPTSEHIPF